MSYDFPILLVFLAIPFVAIGQRFGVPYPLVLVVGGLLLCLVPGLPQAELQPEIVFLVALPPLLFWEAYAAPIGEMRQNFGWVFTLSISLVLLTTAAVAICVKFLEPEIPLAVAIMLGAIVAPTDNIAFSFVAERMGMPRRLNAIVQGESLFNDALALIIYAAALSAALDGEFTPGQDIGAFFRAGFLSIGLGLVVGWVALAFLARLTATELQTGILIVLPYVAFLPAVHFDLSGVLAVVTTGILMSTSSSRVTTFTTRLRFNGFSQTGSFLINSMLFLLVGLQLRVVENDPGRRPIGQLLHDAVILNIVLFAVRFGWVYGRGFIMRLLGHPMRWRYLAVIAWSGMRGSVSMAAALSIPFYLASGDRFLNRHYVLFMTFSVILVTLLGQGLTLGPLVRLLGLREVGADKEELFAMREIGSRALKAVDELEAQGELPEIAALLRRRFDRFSAAFSDELSESSDSLCDEARLRSATLTVIGEQRRALDELSHERRIDFSTQKRIERLLDLQEAETAQIRLALQPRMNELEALARADPP
jgi:CPA1 family monovalent cation:H+ antiporter